MTKDSCIEYAQKIHGRFIFADPLMSSIIYNFLLFVADDENYAHSTKINRLEKYNNIISNDLQSLHLMNINSDWLKDILLETNRDKTTLLIKFIMYLIKINQVKDLQIYRLNFLQSRLNSRVLKSEILYVLEDSHFEEYKGKKFFSEKDGIAAYYLCPDSNDYDNENMYDLICMFIHDYRLSETCKFNSLFASVTYALKMFRIIFHSTKPQDINLQFIRRLLKSTNSDSYFNAFIFTKFLFFGLKANIIPSSDFFQSIMHFQDDILKYTGIDTLQKILMSETPDKYTFIKGDKQKHLFYISHSAKSIRVIISSFIQEYGVTYFTSVSQFAYCFEESLGNQKVEAIGDLSYTTFEQQLAYLKNNALDSIRVLVSFYLYVYRNHNKSIFGSQDFHIDVLQRQTIVNELLDGYKYVLYNPFEKYPDHDKWLLHFNNFDNSNVDKNKNSSKTYDFSTLKSPYYRDLAKYYFWNDTISFSNKLKKLHSFRYFSNFIFDIKTGKGFSFFSHKSNDFTITLNDVVAYKNHVLSTFENGNTINHYIYDIRKILSFLTTHGLITTDKSYFYHLRYTKESTTNDASAIPDAHLELLSNLMKHNANTNVLHKIYYAIFYLQLETEFRISQILTLEKYCVVEAFKDNQFVVRSKSKTSPKDEIEQPITIYVKRQIDEIIKLTSDYRNICHRTNIKNYLFIVPGKRNNMYKAISTRDFNLYLKNCCVYLGIDLYTSSNLRDTHMTKAEEYGIRNSLSNIELGTLTGHKSVNTTTKHYIDTEITELLESVHGVIIGNVEIDGTVLINRPDTIHEEDTVSSNCGYCSSNHCNQFTYLDCMLCKSFVTCLDRIPFFEEQIKVVNVKLEYASTRHDKEDLYSIKSLLVKYLEKLLQLKEECSDAS